MTADILLTGFEPFAGDTVNASWLAVQAVASSWDRPESLAIAELPVVFGLAADRLDAIIAEHRPRLLVATGLAAGRVAVTPERVAINVDDARIPDNAGNAPIDEPIVAGGPAAYFSTLPIKAAVSAIGAAGIPASVSQSAGTFVCNHVFYRLMDAASRLPGMRAGFVHVPSASEHSALADAALPVAQLAKAPRLVVTASLATGSDVRIGGGTIA